MPLTEPAPPSPLSKNELAKALGYKGISARLTAEIDRMLAEKIIVRVMDGSRVKLGLDNVECDDK